MPRHEPLTDSLADGRILSVAKPRPHASDKIFRGKYMFSRSQRAFKVLLDEAAHVTRAILAKFSSATIEHG